MPLAIKMLVLLEVCEMVVLSLKTLKAPLEHRFFTLGDLRRMNSDRVRDRGEGRVRARVRVRVRVTRGTWLDKPLSSLLLSCLVL